MTVSCLQFERLFNRQVAILHPATSSSAQTPVLMGTGDVAAQNAYSSSPDSPAWFYRAVASNHGCIRKTREVIASSLGSKGGPGE